MCYIIISGKNSLAEMLFRFLCYIIISHLPSHDGAQGGSSGNGGGGLKIRFHSDDGPSSIRTQFPDQFAPYIGLFGCTLQTRYDGTLFRFPLRRCATLKRVMWYFEEGVVVL